MTEVRVIYHYWGINSGVNMKLLLNSFLYQKGANILTFDINNFYLQTPLERPEYVRIKLSNLPQDFID